MNSLVERQLRATGNTLERMRELMDENAALRAEVERLRGECEVFWLLLRQIARLDHTPDCEHWHKTISTYTNPIPPEECDCNADGERIARAALGEGE